MMKSSSSLRLSGGNATGTSRQRFKRCPMCPRAHRDAWLEPVRLDSALPGASWAPAEPQHGHIAAECPALPPAQRRLPPPAAQAAAGRGWGQAATSAYHGRGFSHNNEGRGEGGQRTRLLVDGEVRGWGRAVQAVASSPAVVARSPRPIRHPWGGSRRGLCAGHPLLGWHFPCLVLPRLQGISSWGSGTEDITVSGASQ